VLWSQAGYGVGWFLGLTIYRFFHRVHGIFDHGNYCYFWQIIHLWFL